MKNYIISVFRLLLYTIIISSFLNSPVKSSELDSLNYFNKYSDIVFYKDNNIEEIGTRFVINNPIKLEKLKFGLFNHSTKGKAKVNFYGYEGGIPVPKLMSRLIEPFEVFIDTSGFQTIEYTLQNPIMINSQQFFVTLSYLSENLYLQSDNEEKQSTCPSEDGESYLYQVLKKKGEEWKYGKYAFNIEALFENIPIPEKNIFQKIQDEKKGIQDNIMINKCLSLFDYNSDDKIDILIDGKIYENKGNFEFSKVENILDESFKPSLNLIMDINNDGFEDIVLLGTNDSTNLANGITGKVYIKNNAGNYILQNLNIPNLLNPISYSIGDINTDGYADIAIVKLKDSTEKSEIILLVNNQSNGFKQVDYNAGSNENNVNQSLVELIDLNNDMKPEIFLWQKDGQKRIIQNLHTNSLEDKTNEYFIDLSETSNNKDIIGYGADWEDINSDGYVDLLLTSIKYIDSTRNVDPNIKIYINQGPPNYQLLESREKEFEFVEDIRGCKIGDLNNDGLSDFIAASGCTCIPANLYLQEKKGKFEKVIFHSGIINNPLKDDFLISDFNNDGLLDIISINEKKIEFFENVNEKKGNFVDIKVLNKNKIGTKVKVFTKENLYVQIINSGNGYLVQEPLIFHFGLKDNNVVDSVQIIEPYTGNVYTFNNIKINQINKLEIDKNQNKNSIIEEFVIKPNPFNNHVDISYKLNKSAKVTIDIFDLNSNKIIGLTNNFQNDGNYQLQWNGKDNSNKSVVSGVYLIRISVDNVEQLFKLIKN